ncbi:hypothetical protein MKY82_05590 [Paenibacillus sp. FSL W7-1279]|uniref:hypothetical protein n=1 Tax=unclassified Paenibacillus TaxID=185978 RepID=UPI0030D55DDB
MDISASFQLPLTPISFSTAYNSSQTVNNHSMKTYDNSGSTKVRKASAEFAKGKKLEKTGQSFDVIFAVGHYNTPAQKKLNVRWSYNLFNSQDLYAFGPQTKSMYFSYASK